MISVDQSMSVSRCTSRSTRRSRSCAASAAKTPIDYIAGAERRAGSPAGDVTASQLQGMTRATWIVLDDDATPAQATLPSGKAFHDCQG